jgi:MFS family permease
MMNTLSPAATAPGTERPWDIGYEWKAVLILSLGFGLVGIDRFMIMPLFPVMMKDLGLTYQDLGHITGALAVAWGISALFMGNLSDRFGRRRVIVPALIVFSLLVGTSGLAAGAGSLILVRALMGFAEGAFTPPSIVATLEASKPTRHGLNLGLQQAALPFFGLGVAPILVTQLLRVVPWHWIFALVALPGFIVAYFTWRILRDGRAAGPALQAARRSQEESGHRWHHALRHRNIVLNMLGMLCWLTCLVVTSAMLPSYLMDHLHLDLLQMGYVLSALGFGATVGTVAMPALSDRIGRKPVAVLSVIGACICLALLLDTGADPTRLFGLIFGTAFFNFSVLCLTVGPLSAESVPAGLMSTASGLVVGVGEIFGGGIAPAVAGYVAQHFGIQYILHLGLAAMGLGLVVTLLLRETLPRANGTGG